MLKVEGLVKKLGRGLAIENVGFEIEAGDCLGVFGGEASGKSLILRMLAGALEADAGEIRVLAVDIAANRAGAQHRLAYIPETPPAYPQMLAADFLTYIARLNGLPAGKARHQVTQAARLAELDEGIALSADALDRGGARKLALAAALVREPALLIWDEPILGLDALQIRAIRGALIKAADNRTVVFAARDPAGIADLCTHILVIESGRPLFCGRAEHLREQQSAAANAAAITALLAGAGAPVAA